MVNVRYITTHPFSNDLISKILYSFQELYTVSRHCQLSVQSYIFYFISICKQFCEITLQFSISGSKLRITGVDRNENTSLSVRRSKDQLMICNDNISVRTIAKRITVLRTSINSLMKSVSSFGFGSSKHGRSA